MNEPLAITTDRTRHFAPLGAPGERQVPASQGFDWQQERRSFLLWGSNIIWALYSAFTKSRLPESYYAYLESIGLSRAQMVCLVMFLIALGPFSYKLTQHFIENPAEVVAVAKASEHYKSDRLD